MFDFSNSNPDIPKQTNKRAPSEGLCFLHVMYQCKSGPFGVRNNDDCENLSCNLMHGLNVTILTLSSRYCSCGNLQGRAKNTTLLLHPFQNFKIQRLHDLLLSLAGFDVMIETGSGIDFENMEMSRLFGRIGDHDIHPTQSQPHVVG